MGKLPGALPMSSELVTGMPVDFWSAHGKEARVKTARRKNPARVWTRYEALETVLALIYRG